MKKNSLIILLILGLGLTVLALLIFPLIPSRTYTIAPPTWRAELFQPWDNNAQSTTKWIDEAKLHFVCQAPVGAQFRYCGINLFFSYDFTQGKNLTPFSTLKIKAHYQGNLSQVRLFARNYNPAYSNSADANSAKFMKLDLLTDEFSADEISIGLNEFMVADWWMSQRELHRSMLPNEFSNITVLGLDFNSLSDADEPVNVDLQIDSIQFEGPLIAPRHWYLGIIIGWMCAIVGFVSSQLIRLKQAKRYLLRESAKLKKLTNIDTLTGALNRAGIQSKVDALVTGQHSKEIGLILLDIDHFKQINDQFGHDVGDQVLREIANLIQANLREHDVFGRWGGEEFILLTPNASLENTAAIAEKLRLKLPSTEISQQLQETITASFGVTLLLPDESFLAAFKRADISLYEAKSSGRNCIRVVDAPAFDS